MRKKKAVQPQINPPPLRYGATGADLRRYKGSCDALDDQNRVGGLQTANREL
jgi:hypothetical protein